MYLSEDGVPKERTRRDPVLPRRVSVYEPGKKKKSKDKFTDSTLSAGHVSDDSRSGERDLKDSEIKHINFIPY